MKSTRLKRVDHESKKRNRNVNDETDTIRMGWSGLVCLCFILFFLHTCRQWVILICTQFELGWILNTNTRPYLVRQTRIKYLSTWISYDKKNSNHNKIKKKNKQKQKILWKIDQFCIIFFRSLFIQSSFNAYLEDRIVEK